MCNCNKGSATTPKSVAFQRPRPVTQAGVPVVTRSSRIPPRPVGRVGMANRPIIANR